MKIGIGHVVLTENLSTDLETYRNHKGIVLDHWLEHCLKKSNTSYFQYNSGPIVQHYALRQGFHTLPTPESDDKLTFVSNQTDVAQGIFLFESLSSHWEAHGNLATGYSVGPLLLTLFKIINYNN